jgi:tetratricopeptide (TPR) repeat protein
VLCANAQFAPEPQADSPEEFDAYLAVLAAATPAETIATAEAFRKAWPTSPLRGHVHGREFDAHRRLGNEAQAIRSAERALEAAPDNIAVLADLAALLANGRTDPARLARAEQYATRALERAQSLKLPKFIQPGEWAVLEGRVNSQAHVALALVAFKRQNPTAAIREFELAVQQAPSPDPATHYRLGLLYRDSGNLPKARQHLERAAALPEPAIQQLARLALQQLTQK